MDKLIEKAVDKVFGEDDERPQGLHQGGGNLTHGGAYPAGGGYSHADDADLRGAASAAAKDADDGEAFFADILGKVLKNKQPSQIAEEDIDEEDAVQSHRKLFGLGSFSSAAEPVSSSSLGSAAAMQALKIFTSGETTPQSQSQSAFVGLAMAQAAKLFDAQASQGNIAPGADKQSAVMQAGELALKMYLKSHGSQGGGAGGDGGVGGLLQLAGKFMK
ncbi:hypothetical protein N657DRAFT_660940 [Parathielavia appendiculata]|uniref:DUF7721 domain-containing protein n=1 Tax=Parathielavia appendiculata TaxID=2587402 RepID=A0AAN6Z997_9PEZI|nr:hypothetical protein N657DRAFT_660940 [Parathielavia appendiculata]